MFRSPDWVHAYVHKAVATVPTIFIMANIEVLCVCYVLCSANVCCVLCALCVCVCVCVCVVCCVLCVVCGVLCVVCCMLRVLRVVCFMCLCCFFMFCVLCIGCRDCSCLGCNIVGPWCVQRVTNCCMFQHPLSICTLLPGFVWHLCSMSFRLRSICVLPVPTICCMPTPLPVAPGRACVRNSVGRPGHVA